MPPRDAITPSRLRTYLLSDFWMASSKTFVGRRKLAAARALGWATTTEAICAPSMRASERDRRAIGRGEGHLVGNDVERIALGRFGLLRERGARGYDEQNQSQRL